MSGDAAHTKVPLFATRAALDEIQEEVSRRISAVLASRRYVLDQEVAAFEAEFAAYLGATHCVGLNSCTDALAIALRALGVTPDDDVVLPAVTFAATAEAVVQVGARPVFADVEELTWCMTAETAEEALTDRTAAIVPVHLFGNPAPMDELGELVAERNLKVLEDAAQAAGAKVAGRAVGTVGDAGAFSFYPSKNLPAVGDGGALVTDDAELARLARRLREHGAEDRGSIHIEIGFNSRLDEVQAAALRAALPQLDGWTEARRAAAAAYEAEGLGNFVDLPVTSGGGEPCFHLYVVAAAERARLIEGLQRAGIGHRVYYTPPLTEQPAFREFRPDRRLPGAERFAAEGLALPMGPDLGEEEVRQVVAAVREALA